MKLLLDHGALILLVSAVSIFLLAVQVNYLVWVLLFYAVPILYLAFRKPCVIKPAIMPALVFGFLFGLSFEYLNEIGGTWIFPLQHLFLAPNLFFDLIPGEVMLWYFLWAFFVVEYYEYFIDRPTSCTFSYRRIGIALALGFFALAIIVFFEYWLGKSIVLPFAYLITGLAALIPLVFLFIRRKKLFPKLALTIPFLTLFFLIMEYVALAGNYWQFTGEYIFAIPYFGYLLPIEELIFWIILSPAVIAGYHELFLDDEV